jgi:hypothetical protein
MVVAKTASPVSSGKQTVSKTASFDKNIVSQLKKSAVYAGYAFSKGDGTMSGRWGKFSSKGETALNTFHTYILPELNNDGSGEIRLVRDEQAMLLDRDISIEKHDGALIIKIKPETLVGIPSIPTPNQIKKMNNKSLAGPPEMSGFAAYSIMSAESHEEKPDIKSLSSDDLDAIIEEMVAERAKRADPSEKPAKPAKKTKKSV